MVGFLIQSGAEINATDDDNDTPLHYAAGYGFQKVVAILLKHGAKKDMKNDRNLTPSQEAKRFKKGDFKKVIALLK